VGEGEADSGGEFGIFFLASGSQALLVLFAQKLNRFKTEWTGSLDMSSD
jgi:hypothetical protein